MGKTFFLVHEDQAVLATYVEAINTTTPPAWGSGPWANPAHYPRETLVGEFAAPFCPASLDPNDFAALVPEGAEVVGDVKWPKED